MARLASATLDETRFRAVAAANHELVSRFLASLGVADADRDDALQEVLLVCAAKLDTLEAGTERAFLCATARHIACNVRRGARRRQRKAEDFAHAEGAERAPSAEELT